ncbi:MULTISPECIES: carboxymuconolactone decarboxylase family protein [unclassified Modicisalibacter]|uniref:carboxymuconolactone decarboxylase family protein n=1 Tax=unclassified Modicisalibacter TaxID=2679913 RepID=UPI001CCF281C|nr:MULTISPECIES: carboxymuconolactone decarboxylase family protein [unclassified Modicisalibacter]MBZ9558023.1 carboxymuconolactone decarboxylase family protein [Modicisalibacter sp. R2A 31.J]MBZ9573309.1 carboxymuconolactone decarboxylase family protein [Modicisalibacter sp. MOD 31.J]
MSSPRLDLESVGQAMGLTGAAQQDAINTHKQPYLDLLGFVPPRIEARFGTTGVMDPTMVELQEKIRSYALETPHLEPKMVQIILFGMLLMAGNDAAQTHCIAARRCGASWEELQATINLCFLFRGLPAANRGAHMLASVAARETERANHSSDEQ